MNKCADVVRVAYPLFQEEGGGANPTSALQFNINKINTKKGVILNKCWHSRMPIITNWQSCECYAAEYEGNIFAVALWGPPIARAFNNKGMWELRRMAIVPEAPKNTASRMLKVMKILIKRNRPTINKLISYQDTAVHKGTIYKAAGWKATNKSAGSNWKTGRKRNEYQSSAPKIRWEYDL